MTGVSLRDPLAADVSAQVSRLFALDSIRTEYLDNTANIPTDAIAPLETPANEMCDSIGTWPGIGGWQRRLVGS
jgi:hypothetical protein